MASQIVSLDFSEQDTVAALEHLIRMCRANQIAGLIFVAALKHKRKHARYTGSTGRLAENYVEAAGHAGVLHLQLVQHALEQD